jgi:hypothetical protein
MFCFYHAELERRHRRCSARRSTVPTVVHPMTQQDGAQSDPLYAQLPEPWLPFDLPRLEDRHAIQVALSLIITALAQQRIDPKRAALLFYGLQIASTNARQLNPIPKRDPGKVSKTILDDFSLELIAPDEDPEDPEETQDWERPGSATRYWNMLQAEDKAEKDRLKAEAEAALDVYNPFPPPL